MRVIGVIDLLGGLAVRARAGARERYAPVAIVAGVPIPPGDALALAREYVNRFGLSELYVADLDAIRGCAPQERSVPALAALCASIWLDPGASSVADARQARDRGATHVVVGLETLTTYDALAAICRAVEGDVAFSLDLRDGEPILMAEGAVRREPAEQIAARAIDAGARAVIVIDLARVGMGSGLDFGLIARVRAAAPDVILVAGGGVRRFEDLRRLADCGCEGVLVATALHDGRLGIADLTAARQLGRGR